MEILNRTFQKVGNLTKLCNLERFPWKDKSTSPSLILDIWYWEASKSYDRINLFCRKLLTLIILGLWRPNNFSFWREDSSQTNIFGSLSKQNLDSNYEIGVKSPPRACPGPIQCPSCPPSLPFWVKCWKGGRLHKRVLSFYPTLSVKQSICSYLLFL